MSEQRSTGFESRLEDLYSRSVLFEWLIVQYPLFYVARTAHPGSTPPSVTQRNALVCAVVAILGQVVWLHASIAFTPLLIKLRSWASPPDTSNVPNAENAEGSAAEEHLDTTPDVGLSWREVQARRRIYGYNELVPRESARWRAVKVYASACTELLCVSLEIAMVAAVALGHWMDFLLMMILLAWRICINKLQFSRGTAVFVPSVIPDGKCEATVVREGKAVRVPSRELVPGDILILRDKGPILADSLLLIANQEVTVDQSEITSESLCVLKQAGHTVYYASRFVDGDALAMVLRSAKESFAAREIQRLSPRRCMTGAPANQKTTLYVDIELKRTNVARSIMALTSSILATGVVWAARGHIPPQRLMVCLSAMTIIHNPYLTSMSYNMTKWAGAAQMAKGKAILQQISNSVHLLAGIDTLCCDKTGSMSQNKLQMKTFFCLNCTEHELMLTSCLSLPVEQSRLDPIDSMYRDTLEQYPDVKAQIDEYRRLSHQAFDSATLLITSVVESKQGERWKCVRGAPKAVLQLCASGLSETEIDIIKGQTSANAHQGFRTMAVARRREDPEGAWKFMGLTPFDDPPRRTTAPAVQRAQMLGVDVKMITGDAKAIATKAATNYLLSGRNIVNVSSIADTDFVEAVASGSQDQRLVRKLLRTRGYCEAFEHKARIIQLLQQHGRTVAATGDGSNDVPALKQADCGIAVEGSTMNAQAAADVVFLRPGLATIIANVELSRRIFHKSYSYLVYRTALSLFLTIAFLRALISPDADDPRLDLMWVVVSLMLTDGLGGYLAYDESDSHCPPKPCRWRLRPFLLHVLAVTTMLAMLAEGASARLPSVASSEVSFLTVVLVATACYYCVVKYGGFTGRRLPKIEESPNNVYAAASEYNSHEE